MATGANNPCVAASQYKSGSKRSNHSGSRIAAEDGDGVRGARMKPLASFCPNTMGRRPAMVRCGSVDHSRLKQPSANADDEKENLVPWKKKPRTAKGDQQQSSERTQSGSMALLFQALDKCSKDGNEAQADSSIDDAAMKQFYKLRSSLMDSKTMKGAEDMLEPEDKDFSKSDDQFSLCLTSYTQELPLLDRPEARGDQEKSLRNRSTAFGNQSTAQETEAAEDRKPGVLMHLGASCEQTQQGKETKQTTEPVLVTPRFANAAINVAAHWLDLLNLDLKGRLAALKRSRRNVRGVILSGQFGKVKGTLRFEKTERLDEETDKWMNLFMTMDANLAAEGAKLETILSNVQEMQRHCVLLPSQPMIDKLLGRVSHFPQQEGASASSQRVENINRTLSLAASAGAICSTANFALKDTGIAAVRSTHP